MDFFKTRLGRFLVLAYLVVGAVYLSLFLCWILDLYEYHYPDKLIKPTNAIGFQELWSLEVGYDNPRRPRPGVTWYSHRSLLAVDLDNDGAQELLVALNEKNQLLVVKDGKVVNTLTLAVPGEAILDLSEVTQGTHTAKITSATGVDYAEYFYLSPVDLRTGKGNSIGSGSDSLFAEDLNGDGKEEIIEPVPEDRRLRPSYRAVDSNGRELWRTAESVGAIIYIGDLDNDGRKELLTPAWAMIDCQNGSVKRIRQNPQEDIFYAGDIDGDGKVELVAGLSRLSTTVGVYDLNGRRRWGYPLYDVEYAVVGDMNGDGKKEIAVFSRDPKWGDNATADYWIFLFDAQGKLLWNHMVHCDRLYPGAFADINGDGRDELVFFEEQFDEPRVLHLYGTRQ